MPRFITAGESHGQGLIALIDSFPAGFKISAKEVNYQLSRRQAGFGRGPRMRIEHDTVTFLSGIRNGITLGSPIACLIKNKDWANWRDIMPSQKAASRTLTPLQRKRVADITTPRPGHADLAGAIKYDTHNLRNVLERASARETAARVVCGSVARQFLSNFGIDIVSHVISIGKVHIPKRTIRFDDIKSLADKSPVRCIDATTEGKMIAEIKKASANHDTLGGVFEVRVAGLPIGLGDNAQWDKRLDGKMAMAMMSIQSVKGVEIGEAFANSRKCGSKAHDEIYYSKEKATGAGKGFYRRTNRAGGVEGGLSNGEEIIIRAACKPISTLKHPLNTVDLVSKQKAKAIVERSDICVVPAAAVVGEAMAAMVLTSAFLDRFGGDSKREIEANYQVYLKRPF